MVSDNIRYRFALIDGTKDVVNIDSLKDCERNSYSFHCPHCEATLIPVLGIERIHHFRHKGEQCNPDKYLHSLAERVFVEEFNKCVETSSPFLIEYEKPTNCTLDCRNKNNCTHCDNVSINLVKEYETSILESRVDLDDHYRRPDILLSANDGRTLWIEIWVTHETGTDKMMDAPIIEVKINSENDISMIRKHHLKAIKTGNLENAFLSEPVMISRFHTERCSDLLSSLPVHNVILPRRKDTVPHHECETPVFDETQVEWVDLGLPSGTLWAKKIEPYMLIFSNAVESYETYLPSHTNAVELRKYCNQKWDYKTRSIILTGPNGNTLSIECPKKDSTTLWLNQYDNDGVRYFSREYDQYGRCMNITSTQFFINNEYVNKPANILLVKRP